MTEIPLESAINRPRWAAHYEGVSLVRQAVLLAVGISQTQAFEHGNKRAGFASADAFLRLNGMAFVGDSILFAEMLNAIAESPAGSQRDESTERFEQWLAQQVRPPETCNDWTEARQAGVKLARWWAGRLGGIEAPNLSTWDKLAARAGDPASATGPPGVIIDKPNRSRQRIRGKFYLPSRLTSGLKRSPRRAECAAVTLSE